MFDASSTGNLNTAKPFRFNDVLTKFLFRIPEFQRGYSWESDQLRDYIRDLETIIENYPTTSEHHNFGTIQCKHVCYYESVDTGLSDAELFDVSDGQQRLITTLLFLRALGEKMKELGEPNHLDGLVSNFNNSYKERLGGGIHGPVEQIPRLSITKHSPFNDCLRDLILTGVHRASTPSPVRMMKEALDWFKNELEDKNLNQCKDYKKTLLERAEIVLLSNVNSNQHMVFEARNNRGRDVSELDKVKNLIQLIEQRGHISVGLDFPKIWFDSLMDLDEYGLSGRSNENLIVSYAMSLSVRGRHITPNSCYDDFRAKFWDLTERPHAAKESQLEDFVQGYQHVVEAFRQLRREDTALTLPRFSTNSKQLKKAKDALYNIRLSNKEGIMEPVLIASYLSIDVDKLVDFAEVAQTAERALFRIYIAPRSGQGPRRTNWRQSEHHQAAYNIYKNVPQVRAGKTCLPKKYQTSAIKKLHHLLPDEYAINFLCNLTINEAGRNLTNMMQDIIGAKNAYKTSSNWGQYLLFQYEKGINPALHEFWNDTFVMKGRDSRNFTMEHIMPQDPRLEAGGSIENYWLRDKMRGFASPEESEAYLHRLGNLVMARAERNSWYGNHPYRMHRSDPAGSGAKRAMYRDRVEHGGDWSRVYQIGGYYNHWGKHKIVHRHALIALWAVGRWKMNCSCDDDPSEEDMRILDKLDDLTQRFEEDFGDKDWYKPEADQQTIDDEEVELEDEEDLFEDDETLVVNEEQEEFDNFTEELNRTITEGITQAHLATQPTEIEISNATERNVWIEKTKTKDGRKEIPDRISGARSLGRAIWSPQRGKPPKGKEHQKGADIYSEMRKVRKGDLVIHLVINSPKETYISGVSVVKNDGVIEDKSVQWAGRECPGYRHELESYIELREPINRSHLLSEGNKEELNEIAQEGKVFYTSGLELRQGHYLTPCTPRLSALLNQICKQVNNSPLPHFEEEQALDINSTKTTTPSLEQKSVKEVEQYYGGNANLGPAWPDDNFVFGSERPGYHNRGRVKNSRVNSWAEVMKAHGIKRVVCLLHPEGKLGLYDDLESQYNSHFGSENVLMAPIIDRDISTKENIKNIVDFLDESERLELPVVVHCSAGMGRTGHVLAVWRNHRWLVDRDKALKDSNWGDENRWPLEALSKDSRHLGRPIDRVDYYDLMDEVRMEEEE